MADMVGTVPYLHTRWYGSICSFCFRRPFEIYVHNMLYMYGSRCTIENNDDDSRRLFCRPHYSPGTVFYG